jgi:hypothetical protein
VFPGAPWQALARGRANVIYRGVPGLDHGVVPGLPAVLDETLQFLLANTPVP